MKALVIRTTLEFVAKPLYKRKVIAIYKEQCNEDRE